MDSIKNKISTTWTSAKLIENERNEAMAAENQKNVDFLQKGVELANWIRHLQALKASNAEPERIRNAKRAVNEAFHARQETRAELMITHQVFDVLQEKFNEAVTEHMDVVRDKKRLCNATN